jgi:Protein of unknown function (DUF3592)
MERPNGSAGYFRRIDSTWESPTWWNLFVVVPWLLMLAFLTYSAISHHIVAKRQQTSQAIITAHEKSNHDQYRFAFSVDGQKYDGLGRTDKEELEIGEKVVVYYDPHNPSKNALKSFETLSLEDFGPIPTLLLGIGAITWMIKAARRRKSQTPG